MTHLYVKQRLNKKSESEKKSWLNKSTFEAKKWKKRKWTNKSARIVIVGAGTSGVHFASLLKSKGYENITILESNSSSGGKLSSKQINLSNNKILSSEEAYAHEGHVPVELGFPGDINILQNSALSKLLEDYKMEHQTTLVKELDIQGKSKSVMRLNRVGCNSDDSDESDSDDDTDIDDTNPESTKKGTHHSFSHSKKSSSFEIFRRRSSTNLTDIDKISGNVVEESFTSKSPFDDEEEYQGIIPNTNKNDNNFHQNQARHRRRNSNGVNAIMESIHAVGSVLNIGQLIQSSSEKKRVLSSSEKFSESIHSLGEELRQASFSALTPFQRILKRSISDLSEQMNMLVSGRDSLALASSRYLSLHKKLLGKYNCGMPPKPKKGKDMEELSLPFIDLLKKHDLLALIPIFLLCPIVHSHQMFYELPALYLLWWYNPERMAALVDIKTGTFKIPQYKILRGDGWQSVLKKIIESHNIKVKYNATVTRIVRKGTAENGAVIYQDNTTGIYEEIVFDKLVLAGNIQNLMNMIQDKSKTEEHLANNMNTFTLCTSLLEYEKDLNERPIELYPFPKKTNIFGQVYATVNPRLVIKSSFHGDDREKEYESFSKSSKDLRVVYQFLNRKGSKEDKMMLKRRIKMFADDKSIKNHKIIQQKMWPYFTHFGSSEILKYDRKNKSNSFSGGPWKLYDIQGENDTVYIGAGASIDSVNEILLYNEKLAGKLLHA